jgi:transcriptional regulator with XRE-family HTH domain
MFLVLSSVILNFFRIYKPFINFEYFGGNTLDNTIMTNLQRLIEPRGVGSKLGKAIGVTDQNIHAWRKGTSKPSQRVLPAIAEFFNVSVAYIRDETNDPTPEAKNSPANSEESAGLDGAYTAEVAEILKGLNEENKQHWLALGQALVQPRTP